MQLNVYAIVTIDRPVCDLEIDRHWAAVQTQFPGLYETRTDETGKQNTP